MIVMSNRGIAINQAIKRKNRAISDTSRTASGSEGEDVGFRLNNQAG